MEFLNFEIKDAENLNRFLRVEGEFSCENSFVNLWAWQSLYNNKYAYLSEGIVVLSGVGESFFSLPFGGDLKRGVEEIIEGNGGKLPIFWVQESARFDDFLKHFGHLYDVKESAVDADYIYSREKLSTLAGKKYHSKRNHISAFSRKFDWHYEPIGEENVEEILVCTDKWYSENLERVTEEMECEKDVIKEMIINRELLGVLGGAIFVDNIAVAYCLGSPLNNSVFDIHIEKGLSDFQGAYAVINREFAFRELDGYEYINREDDLGIEGLRRAKLSYNPEFLLKKFLLLPKEGL